MIAAKLRHYIAIERRVKSGDRYTWQPFAWAWADKQPLSVREFLNADQALSKAEGYFVIRYMDGVDATMRIVMGESVYNIMGVLEDKGTGRDWLTLPYAKGTNEG